MKNIFALALALILAAAPAHADPISTLILGSLGVSATVTAITITTFALRTVATVGLSLLSRALAKKKAGGQRRSGVRIEGTTVGVDIAQSFVVGRYPTGGHLEYHNSFGQSGGTPNVKYVRVFSLSDIPGVSLRRVMISEGWVTLGTTADPDGLGYPVLKYRKNGNDYAWVKFYDGTQTVADPFLVSAFGADPDQPWTSNHVGTGVAYAIVTMWVDREQFQGVPQVKFELDGIPLYDPRKDTTVGGSGSHRWSDTSTWETSDNNAVIAYNIFRGIPMPDGNTYGGGFEAADLPLANWFYGMNVCDTIVSGGTRKTFRAGLEIEVDQEPASYIEELLSAGMGQVSEMGGVIRSRWGAPNVAVMSITDDDISVDDPQEYDPFPGLEETYNAVRITHPGPAQLWEPVQTAANYNATWEAEDGGRRLPVQMDVPACFDHGQAQQLANAYALDHRRWRRHSLVLPPDAFALKTLDTITWTSDRNGYVNKVFEVMAISYRPFSLMTDVHLRERDPTDYDWNTSQELAAPPDSPAITPPTRVIYDPDWSITAIAVKDDGSNDRRPAIRLSWGPTLVEDTHLVDWQVELVATGEQVASGSARGDAGEVVLSMGILPLATYRARLRPNLSMLTAWTSWKQVVTLDIRLEQGDLSDALYADLNAVEAADIQGIVDATSFASGITGVEIVGTLPSTGNFEGRYVLLTTDYKLYRHTGSPADETGFTRAVDGADLVADSVTTGALAAGAVNTDQLAAGAVIAKHMGIGDFTNLNLDAEFEDTGYWTEGAGTITYAASGDAQTWGSANVMDLQSVLETDWAIANGPVFELDVAGEEFYVEFQGQRLDGSSNGVYLQLQYADDPAFTTNVWRDNTASADQTTVTTVQDSVVSPAGARYARWRVRKGNSGFTRGQIGGLIIRRKNKGELIVDGGIKANHVSANEIITASANIADAIVTNAKIAGALQSSNFSSGSAGWQIDKTGSAEFNALTVRGWLQDKAASDWATATGFSTAITRGGDQSAWLGNAVLGNGFAVNDLYHLNWFGRYRGEALDGTTPNTTYLQARYRFKFGNTWNGWIVATTSTANGTDNWWTFTHTEHVQGDAPDDLEMELLIFPNRNLSLWGQTNFANMGLRMQVTVK